MPNNLAFPTDVNLKTRAVINGLNDINFNSSYLSSFFPNTTDLNIQHWGLARNPFYEDEKLGKTLKNLFRANPEIHDSKLNTVLIYSTFNHYVDGFKYFKNFIKSILNNDFKIAAHLLYYAEFRWLNCLLGSQGIFGVDGNTYLYSTSNGMKKFDLKSTGSHEAMWLLFKHWCDTNEADNLFKNSFEVHGISITDWMSSANLITSSSSPKILSDLIYNLTSNDKLNFLADRDFRNKASYDGLNKPSSFNDLDLKFSFDFLINHYNGLLSLDSDNDFFEILDLEILKILFTRKTNQINGTRNIKKAKRKQINRIYKSIQNACLSLNKTVLFGHELTHSIIKDNIFESLLLQGPEQSDNEALLKIFYRSLLLMKLASSSIKIMLSDANLNTEYLKPWFLYKLKHSYWLKNLDNIQEFNLEEISYNSRLDYFTSYSDYEIDFASMATNDSISDLWDIDDSKNLDILRLSDIDIASVWSLA